MSPSRAISVATCGKHRAVARQCLILILTAFLLAVGLTAYDRLVSQRSAVPGNFDFTKFYLSARAIDAGGDMYRPVAVTELGPLPAGLDRSRETLHPNLNTPFANLLLWPFAYTDLPTAVRIWTLVSLGFVLSAAWTLSSALSPKEEPAGFQRWMAAGLLALFLLAYYPSLVNAALGQFGQVLLVVLAGAWLAAGRGHDRLAGMLFGLALALKPFSGLLLLIVLWLRRWRLFRWYAGTFAALMFGSLLVAGPDAFFRFVEVLGEVNWHASGWNASLMAPLSVVFGGGEVPGWFPHPWLGRSIWLATSAALCALLMAPIGKIDDRQQQLDLAVAGAMPLMLLISPLGWLYYFPVIWIAGAALFTATRHFAARRPWRIAALGALVLCGLPFPFVLTKDAGSSFGALLAGSADTGALLVAYFVATGAAWHMARHGHAPAGRSSHRTPSSDRPAARPPYTADFLESASRLRAAGSKCP